MDGDLGSNKTRLLLEIATGRVSEKMPERKILAWDEIRLFFFRNNDEEKVSLGSYEWERDLSS